MGGFRVPGWLPVSSQLSYYFCFYFYNSVIIGIYVSNSRNAILPPSRTPQSYSQFPINLCYRRFLAMIGGYHHIIVTFSPFICCR